jgi:hypothetical protein
MGLERDAAVRMDEGAACGGGVASRHVEGSVDVALQRAVRKSRSWPR